MLRKILLVGLGLSAQASVFALGLGEIRLDSALNQPLVAEIPITITSRDELRGFEARVAMNETFARYGLDRPVFLNSLQFRVRNNTAGQPILSVTSIRPIAEPFVTFLLEATWDSGRLLREYTVLLDPPVFNDRAVAAPVNVAQSVTARPSTTSGQIVTPAPVPTPAPRPEPRSVYRQPAITGQTYGPVQRNQNLWNISRSVQLNDVTINQMMVAIYRANPEAFQGNINRLKEGSTLQIPDADSVRALLRSDANSVVVAHNSEWRGGVAASGGRVTAASPGATSGSRNTRLKLVAPDSSQGGAGSADGAADLDAAQELLAQEQAENAELTSQLDAVREELEQAKRLINLKNADLAELQDSLARENTAEAPVELAVSELPDETETGETETGETATDEAVAETGTDAAIADVATAPPVTDPTSLLKDIKPEKPVVDTGPVESESIASKILGFLTKPLFLIGLALLGILGTLFVIFRNRGNESEEPWDAISADADEDVNMDLDASLDKVARQSMAKDSADITAREVEYFEDTGTFKPIDFDASESGQMPALNSEDEDDIGEAPYEDTLAGDMGVKLDQADALSEADFHMAYGLYDQAAELVGKASEQEPERVDLKMKLLEIFFVWGNKDAFRAEADASKNLLTAQPGEWDKILIMGKQICPDDELFSGEASGDSVVGGVDLQLDTESSDVSGIDFEAEDFGGADIFSDAGGDGKDDDDVVDLDLGDALFASDDAPTATGSDTNILDFSFDDDGFDDASFDDEATAIAPSDDDAPTASVEAVKDKIEAVLATNPGEDTEEMDLDQLGIDLDFGDITSVSAGTSGEFAIHDTGAKAAESNSDDDFNELFDGLGDDDEDPAVTLDVDMLSDHEAHDKLLDTSELKVEMEELLNADQPGLTDSDETSRGVETLIADEDLLAELDSPLEATGSFSAEIRSLANDELEIGDELAAASSAVDFGFDDDDDTVLQETLVMPGELSNPDDNDKGTDAFADSDEETVLASTLVVGDSDEVDLSEPFEDASQVTTAMPIVDPDAVDAESTGEADSVTFHGIFDEPEGTQSLSALDEFSDDVFPNPDGRTQEVQAMDLDVGGSVDDSGDNTTMRVATSNLALPENAELAINEVGTKLDLARAYLDMGDPDGARGILEEVVQEGNDNQQADARALLDGIA